MNEALNPNQKNGIIKSRIPVLVSGLPGRMGQAIVEALQEDPSFDPLPIAKASARYSYTSISIGKGQQIHLIDHLPLDLGSGVIAIDYTTPQSVENNARHYIDLKIPFIMGTTGGDREVIKSMVRSSEISAVIAPIMAVPVIEIQ